jgi:glycosyltransferase involved in cell wall biosynthesis
MHSNILSHGVYRGLYVIHPRFPIIPRYLKFLDAFSLLLSSFTSIYRLRKEFAFDLIDLHWTYPEIMTGAFWAFWNKCGYIVTIRGNEALYATDNGIRRFILNYFLKRANAVITLSSDLKTRVKEIGIEEDKIHVVLNGVNVDEFKLLDKLEARKHLSLPQESLILLTVGSLILTKGHQHLIGLMPALSKDYPVELYVIGGVGPAGDDLDHLKSQISRLGLQNVHLVGMKSTRN